MSAVFLKLLNLSITASWLILAVILVRFLLKKAPKWISCVLWALVAVRLVCPFSLESALSLIPSSETIPSNIEMMQKPAIDSGITVINETINPAIAHSFTPDPMTSANPLQIIIPVLSIVWIVGMVAMLLYALISYIRLKKSVGASVPVRDNILACDEVKSPFILGIFKPLIYIPSSMEGEAMDYVITHESAHIQRRDHWWKPFGYLLLTVYWFNPLCWLAYVLLCRDIEMACDEKVIRDMDKGSMAEYSQALLDCSFPRKRIAACPLAFGEVGVKERVKSVLNYKKPAFWIIVVAIVVCIVVAVCFLTNPFSDKSLSGKLGVSMDMAVAEYNHSAHSDGNFIATDYDVLRITKGKGKTTVYAWVYYAEYSFDGIDVEMESASHIPTVVTFDTSADGRDSSSYDVIEYWIPGDGSDYAKDIRSKFPMLLWSKAFDVSGASLQKEKCLQAAKEYFSSQTAFHTFTENADGTFTADNGKTYQYKLELVGRSPGAVCDACYVVLSNNKDLTFERVNESIFTSNTERFLDYDEAIIISISALNETPNSIVSSVGGVDGPESITVNIRKDVCELYLSVLEDLWNVDPGLNDGISQIGIDLSELSHLTELEKETVMHEFASKHNLPYIAGTWEELCEQGYIDKDNLYWEDGLFFSIKTNEDTEWNLPALKEGDSVPELTAFDAQKWRSGLGAYFFGQCTAQKSADGKWSYTVGQEAIS